MSRYAFSRREFLRLMSVSGVGISLSVRADIAAQSTATPAMQRRPIPSTGELMPVIGLGSAEVLRRLPKDGMQVPVSLLNGLLDSGGRLVDSWLDPRDRSPLLGKLLDEEDFRQRLFVVTRINARGREAGVKQLEYTQRVLGKRPLDLVMVQNLRDLDTQWQTLQEWKQAGRIRYIGATISNRRDYAAMQAFLEQQQPDFIQVNYSVLEPTSGAQILPLAAQRKIAVMVNRPFINGLYFDPLDERELPAWCTEFDCRSWAQFSLKYILAHPAVTCVLTETNKLAHLLDNAEAGRGRLPDADHLRRMDETMLAIWTERANRLGHQFAG